jgi:hypothetical protein
MITWMDNFENYGTNTGNLLNGIYADHSYLALTVDPDVNAGGRRVIRVTSAANQDAGIRKVVPTHATYGIACRVWMDSLPGATNYGPRPAWFRDANNKSHMYWQVSPSGEIMVYNGQNVLIHTSVPCMVANAWQHVETKCVIHASAGTFEVRVDGVPRVALTGIQTSFGDFATVTNVMLVNRGNNTGTHITVYYKDFITWDGSGDTNTNFVGSCTVVSLTPNADVSLNWTPNTGTTGFDKVNQTSPDDDTTYISAFDPAPAPAVLELSNLPIDVTSVKSLMTLIRSKKTDGGDAKLRVGLVSGGSTGEGEDRPITPSYTYWTDLFPKDPATNAPWTPVAVDAARLKLNRTL